MSVLNYKGYDAKVEFDSEDEIFFGQILGIRDNVTFHGETVKELKAAFLEAVDFYFESCKKTGRKPNKPYSGKFVVRVPSDLHGQVSVLAANKGQSLNKWMEDVMINEVRGQN